jgi:hypothetical protein
MSENASIRKDFRWKFIVRLIIFLLYLIFLYELFWLLIDLGSSILLAILILFFAFLLFLGLLFKRKGESLFSRFRRKPPKLPSSLDKNKQKPRIRRVDIINLDESYKKPIIRKCSKCGMQLAGFVKKCPNCGEKIVMN